jgi:Leucine-rich repeat (LRR) protein
VLPVLPDGLIFLGCDNNKITELPVLPNGLIFLGCSYNLLNELPVLPNGLIELYCDDNPIKYITPDMYSIMKRIYLTDENSIDISDTIFYDNSGCSSEAEFFGCE